MENLENTQPQKGNSLKIWCGRCARVMTRNGAKDWKFWRSRCIFLFCPRPFLYPTSLPLSPCALSFGGQWMTLAFLRERLWLGIFRLAKVGVACPPTLKCFGASTDGKFLGSYLWSQPKHGASLSSEEFVHVQSLNLKSLHTNTIRGELRQELTRISEINIYTTKKKETFLAFVNRPWVSGWVCMKDVPHGMHHSSNYAGPGELRNWGAQ